MTSTDLFTPIATVTSPDGFQFTLDVDWSGSWESQTVNDGDPCYDAEAGVGASDWLDTRLGRIRIALADDDTSELANLVRPFFARVDT